MSPARLLSVNVGLPRDIAWEGRTVHTAIWKSPVRGRVRVRRLNIDGDGQGDLAGHGGEQRAVYVYQTGSYRYWEKELGRSDFVPGQFGENFTVDGLADDETCIGDRFRVGSTVLEVTQPRVTCYRVGIRMNDPRMAALLTGSGRPGFYCRVIEEGDVGAGDPIVKIADGPERMTVAAINALLYLPGHPREALERALRIPALSPGWRTSFQALLAPPRARAGPAPGFAPLRVKEIVRECEDVLSLALEPTDGRPLAVPEPGQFVVLRFRPTPDRAPVFRSYSLSGPPSAERYRVSVKIEPHGIGGAYLSQQLHTGDLVDVSSARGAFVLRPSTDPVVLMSAGIGATPVLAMLHALVAAKDGRDIWWLYGARNHATHPFADEVKRLLAKIENGRCHVFYSRPEPTEQLGRDFDTRGRVSAAAALALGVPRVADFYLCGPQMFLDDLHAGLATSGVTPDRIHSETFGGGESITPGVVGAKKRAPHVPDDASANASGPSVSFARSGLVVHAGSVQKRTLLQLAEASDVPVRWSCRTGVCHTCECGLVSGSVTYDPQPLEPPAEGNVLICCSRANGDIVLDL